MGKPKVHDAHLLAERLVQWFRKNGGVLSPDVEIRFSDADGFHCRASKPLCSGVVATCPLSLTLSYLSLDRTESSVLHVDSSLEKCLGQVPNHVLTYLLLIEQKAKKTASPWSPYLACLPKPESMTTPLWFDAEDMRCLAGTNLAWETKVKLDQLTGEWTQAAEAMQRLGISADTFSL